MFLIPIRIYSFKPAELPPPESFADFKLRLQDPSFTVGEAPTSANFKREGLLLAVFAVMLAAGLSLHHRGTWLSPVLGLIGGLMGFGTLLSLVSLATAVRVSRLYNALLRESAARARTHDHFVSDFGSTHSKYLARVRR